MFSNNIIVVVVVLVALIAYKGDVHSTSNGFKISLSVLGYQLTTVLTKIDAGPEIESPYARLFPLDNRTLWIPEADSDPGANGPIVVRVLTSCCEFEEVEDPLKATLLWPRYHVQLKDVESKLKLGKGQIVARLRNTASMTDKANLHRLLVKAKHTELQPETYVIGDTVSECKRFFATVAKNPKTIWVAKEPGSAQGEGIRINPDVNKFKEKFLVDPNADENHVECKQPFNKTEEEFVIQKYILNPLLLKKKKMEIRTYWLIASLHPLIVLYHDGTVRLTTADYKNDDWENSAIHITNTAQQEKSNPDVFTETVGDLKWTLPSLAAYLESEGKVKNGTTWMDGKLKPHLKYIIKTVINAAYAQLISEGTGSLKADTGRFELLGMDVILDDNLFPWLTEIQFSPGLSMDPGYKMTLVPQIIEEIVGIVLEVDVRKRYKLPLSANGLVNLKHFEVIDTYY